MLGIRILSVICLLCLLLDVVTSGTLKSSANSQKASEQTKDEVGGKSKSEKMILDPDVEIIDVDTRKPVDNRDITIASGMDPDAIEELNRTKQPVVRTKIEPDGKKITTTYSLLPDGTISKHTKTEYQPKIFTRTFQYPSIGQPPMYPHSDWEWPSRSPPSPNNGFPSYDHNWPPVPPLLPNGHNGFTPLPDEQGGHDVQLPESWNPNEWSNEGTDSDTPRTVTKTFIDEQGRKVTTTYTIGPTTRRRFGSPTFTTFPTHHYPHINTKTTTTTTMKPTIKGLDDFLKRQYGPVTIRPPVTTTTRRSVSSTPPVKKIRVEDLPKFNILDTGNGVVMHPVGSDDIIKTTSLENIPEGKPKKTTTTYTKTIHGNKLPTSKDLDPEMRKILERAGIKPEDVLKTNRREITKVRKDPEGNTVTTTFQVQTIPTNTKTKKLDKPVGPFPFETPELPPREHLSKSNAGTVFPTFEQPKHTVPRGKNIDSFGGTEEFGDIPLRTHKNPIDAFLAKVGLTPHDIDAKHGEIVKTFIDDNGRVLTATFVLSTLKHTDPKQPAKTTTKPLK